MDPITRHEFDLLQSHFDGKLSSVDIRLGKLDESLTAMWSKLDGRPSWAVLAIITFLTALSTGLIVFMVGKT